MGSVRAEGGINVAVKILDTVMEALNGAGIPTIRAWSKGSMPQLTEVRAAVALEKLDHIAQSASVAVTVVAPMAMGGSVCEDTAIRVSLVLAELGGLCVQEACKFTGYADTYSVRVLGTFSGAQVMEDWLAVSEFTVTLGGIVQPNAVGFQAEQAVDEATGEPVAGAYWTFRLEEQFRPGQGPLPPPTEPFALKVERTGGTETFNGCRLTAVQLENTAKGLRQVRRGVAESRSFIILI